MRESSLYMVKNLFSQISSVVGVSNSAPKDEKVKFVYCQVNSKIRSESWRHVYKFSNNVTFVYIYELIVCLVKFLVFIIIQAIILPKKMERNKICINVSITK